MGYYIETDSNHGKAEWLVKNAKGVLYTHKPEDEEVLPGHVPVVVVNNGPFEAAGIAFSVDEYEAFTEPRDHRPKKYVVIPVAEAERLQPMVKGHIQWP